MKEATSIVSNPANRDPLACKKRERRWQLFPALQNEIGSGVVIIILPNACKKHSTRPGSLGTGNVSAS